jgi:hypothetical protein
MTNFKNTLMVMTATLKNLPSPPFAKEGKETFLNYTPRPSGTPLLIEGNKKTELPLILPWQLSHAAIRYLVLSAS